MRKIRDLNIKNRTYYYFDYMIDKRKFKSDLLKIDKMSHREFDIYYIGYDTIKKFDDWKNICSMNPLYLVIYSATGYFKEKNSDKYLILNSNKNMKKFFLKLNQKLKPSMEEKNYFMKTIMLELV